MFYPFYPSQNYFLIHIFVSFPQIISCNLFPGNHLSDQFGELTDAISLNTEVVMLSLEDIEDHVHTVVNLQKNLKEMRTKSEFQV